MPPRSARLLLITISLIVLAAGVGLLVGRTTAPDSTSSDALISIDFGPEQIWQPSPDASAALGKCPPNQPNWRDCVWGVMQQDGASRDAFEFFRLTDAFLTELQGNGQVKIGTLLYRWRANELEQLVLLGGDPLVVRPEAIEARPITSNIDYQGLRAAHPNLLFWAAGPLLESSAIAPDGSQSFVFRYRLLDGCHACDILGYARVQFDVAANGRFLDVAASGGFNVSPSFLGIVAP